MTEEIKKIGYDGLIKTLKENCYEPVGIHNPGKYLLSLSSPNIKKKRCGKITLFLPTDLFNNTEDTRQFNQGKYRMLILFIEDNKPKEEKKP